MKKLSFLLLLLHIPDRQVDFEDKAKLFMIPLDAIITTLNQTQKIDAENLAVFFILVRKQLLNIEMHSLFLTICYYPIEVLLVPSFYINDFLLIKNYLQFCVHTVLRT